MKGSKKFIYKLRLAGIRFLLMGILGYAVEIYATTYSRIIELINQGEFWLKAIPLATGHTHVGALLIYGSATFVYSLLHEPFLKVKFLQIPVLGAVLRAGIYALFFMLVELIFGLIVVYILRFKLGEGGMWDYSSKWGNILGLTTFSMYPAWWLAGLIGEFIHIRMIAIDDILVNFKDNEYYTVNTRAARVAYYDKKEVITTEKHAYKIKPGKKYRS